MTLGNGLILSALHVREESLWRNRSKLCPCRTYEGACTRDLSAGSDVLSTRYGVFLMAPAASFVKTSSPSSMLVDSTKNDSS